MSLLELVGRSRRGSPRSGWPRSRRSGPTFLACAIALAWMACGDNGSIIDPPGAPSRETSATPAQSSSQPGGGGEKARIACQREDIDILGIAPESRSLGVEASVNRECTVGLASYERPGGGPTTQTKFRDSGGKKLRARERTVLRVELPCGAFQADLYFNLDSAPDVPRFHGGNLVKGWTGATSCSTPPDPPTCNPPCQGRDVCVNGVCIPPNPVR
jgi:hypothetical protein